MYAAISSTVSSSVMWVSMYCMALPIASIQLMGASSFVSLLVGFYHMGESFSRYFLLCFVRISIAPGRV